MVCRPLKGNHFSCYFEILLVLAWNAESAKNCDNKHHSLTRKIGLKVISSFMIDWPASTILISFYKTNFFSFMVCHGFQKISKSWKIAIFRDLWAEKQCNKFENFGLSIKNVIDSKMHSSCLNPIVLSIFKSLCQLLNGLSFCAEIFRIILKL